MLQGAVAGGSGGGDHQHAGPELGLAVEVFDVGLARAAGAAFNGLDVFLELLAPFGGVLFGVREAAALVAEEELAELAGLFAGGFVVGEGFEVGGDGFASGFEEFRG